MGNCFLTSLECRHHHARFRLRNERTGVLSSWVPEIHLLEVFLISSWRFFNWSEISLTYLKYRLVLLMIMFSFDSSRIFKFYFTFRHFGKLQIGHRLWWYFIDIVFKLKFSKPVLFSPHSRSVALSEYRDVAVPFHTNAFSWLVMYLGYPQTFQHITFPIIPLKLAEIAR
jgi:hypothetical protein